MTDTVISAHKVLGETPLACLERVRLEKGIAAHVPMTYAGRLDPMASGLLLILVGDECKKKDEYLGLDKEYEVEVLLGVKTDTGDILGMPSMSAANSREASMPDDKVITHMVSLLPGTRVEPYPMYSSKPVNGKPLFVHAREGSIDDIEVPQKEITIYGVDFMGAEVMPGSVVLSLVEGRIQKIVGDFRQEEIVKAWRSLCANEHVSSKNFPLIRIKVHASSGAYMRTLAERLGTSLNVDALAWSIKRTQIGEYTLKDTAI